MNVTNFDPHRHVILATRPDVFVQFWSRQCISVELGMYLLSAHGAELEGRRDDDKRNPLRLTKNNCGLLRHLLVSSVG